MRFHYTQLGKSLDAILCNEENDWDTFFLIETFGIHIHR